MAPSNLDAAITIRFAATDSKTESHCMRKNTQTHRSSHYSADYSKTWPKPACAPCTHEVPSIAGCSYFTRKNARFRAAAFPPTQESPCNSHAAMWCKLSHHPSLLHHPSLCIVSYSLTSLIVMRCKLSHHPSLSIASQVLFLCDVNFHTILHSV